LDVGDAFEGDDGSAECAVDNREIETTDLIQSHLVPGENALRIRSRLTIHEEPKDDVRVL
jgi:hypothetical protein